MDLQSILIAFIAFLIVCVPVYFAGKMSGLMKGEKDAYRRMSHSSIQVKDLPPDEQDKYQKRHEWLRGHIEC